MVETMGLTGTRASLHARNFLKRAPGPSVLGTDLGYPWGSSVLVEVWGVTEQQPLSPSTARGCPGTLAPDSIYVICVQPK